LKAKKALGPDSCSGGRNGKGLAEVEKIPFGRRGVPIGLRVVDERDGSQFVENGPGWKGKKERKQIRRWPFWRVADTAGGASGVVAHCFRGGCNRLEPTGLDGLRWWTLWIVYRFTGAVSHLG